MRNTSIMLTIAIMVLAAPSASSAVRPWVRGAGGYAMYSMTDWNNNEPTFLKSNNISANKISGGLNFDGCAGLEFGNGFSLGAGYLSLGAKETGSRADGFAVDIKLPATAPYAFAEFAFANNNKADAVLGVGVGSLTLDGTETLTAPGFIPSNLKFHGSGTMFQLYAGGVAWAGPQFGLFGSAGYRSAKIKEVKDPTDGQTWIWTSTGTNIELDYSGAYATAGVVLTLRK